jgi:hypothetical protein
MAFIIEAIKKRLHYEPIWFSNRQRFREELVYVENLRDLW